MPVPLCILGGILPETRELHFPQALSIQASFPASAQLAQKFPLVPFFALPSFLFLNMGPFVLICKSGRGHKRWEEEGKEALSLAILPFLPAAKTFSFFETYVL